MPSLIRLQVPRPKKSVAKKAEQPSRAEMIRQARSREANRVYHHVAEMVDGVRQERLYCLASSSDQADG